MVKYQRKSESNSAKLMIRETLDEYDNGNVGVVGHRQAVTNWVVDFSNIVHLERLKDAAYEGTIPSPALWLGCAAGQKCAWVKSVWGGEAIDIATGRPHHDDPFGGATDGVLLPLCPASPVSFRY